MVVTSRAGWWTGWLAGWLAGFQANGKVYDHPEYRYILSFRATDHTGSTFVTAFNDQAVEIMGCTAGELKRLQEENKDACVPHPVVLFWCGISFQSCFTTEANK